MNPVCKTDNAEGGRPIHLVSAVVVGALLGWSLIVGYETVASLQISREWDVLRDISIAQALYDGRFPEDPILLGEISWYNPLTGFMIALVGLLSSSDLLRLGAVLGPFVNLITPLAFYFLVALLFGRAAALAGLCMVLFGKEDGSPPWTSAYSPWLMAPMYSQGLLFLTLSMFFVAVRRQSATWYYGAGVLLGITFMSHTAPAIIAGGTMLLVTGWEAAVEVFKKQDRARTRRLTGYFILLLLVAFFMSLPFSGPILWRYQFRMENPWPSLFASPTLTLAALPGELVKAVSVRNALALAGLAMLFPRHRELAVKLVFCWGIVTVMLVIQHYLWQYFLHHGVIMTSLVPGHHAVIHLSAVRTVLFGVGICGLGAMAGKLLVRSMKNVWNQAKMKALLIPMGQWVAVALACMMLYARNPYPDRMDFTPPCPDGYHQIFEQHLPVYNWILENTPPYAVFYCHDESIGMTTVMPAGRKLVFPMLLYSNPYVDRGTMEGHNRFIEEALANHDEALLCEVLERYPHLYLLLNKPIKEEPPFSLELFQTDQVVVYEVHADCLDVDENNLRLTTISPGR